MYLLVESSRIFGFIKMVKQANRKIQYLAGTCASLCFMFTGATLSWPSPAIPKFRNGEAHLIITDSQSSWVVSLLAVGAIPGCFLGQCLSEKFGRRRTILYAAIPALTGAGIILFTKTPELMYIARFTIGIGTGITAVVTMIYVTEISDKQIRGSLGMVVQVMNNFGSLLVYGVGPFVSYRILNIIIVSIPLCFFLACLWIPESPYYYLKDDNIAAARKSFLILQGSKDEKIVDEELNKIRAHVRDSMENKTTLKELLTNSKYRKAIYIVFVLKVLQYMTGILVIQSYLEPIFRHSGAVSGPLASIIYGFVQLAAGIVATFLARWLGRRVLMNISCAGVGTCLTLVGIYFFLQDYIKINQDILESLSSIPLCGILGFIVFYSVGLGNIPYVMQAELFPMNVKVLASSLATILACLMSFIVTKCFLHVQESFGHYTVFWSFAVIAYLGIVFVCCFMPETGGKTLEEVQDNVQDALPEEKTTLRGGDKDGDEKD